MGKKKKTSGAEASLGRSLIKDHVGSSRGKKMVSDNTMVKLKCIKFFVLSTYMLIWIICISLAAYDRDSRRV